MPGLDSHAGTLSAMVTRDRTVVDVTDRILTASLDRDADARIPARLTLTAVADPAERHAPPTEVPFSPHGQRIRVAYTATAPGLDVTIEAGTYIIRAVRDSGDGTVTVEASSLLLLVDDARFITPTQPPSSATFTSELRRLTRGILPVIVDTALTDRDLPNSIGAEWVEDRLGALLDIVEAWPAVLRVDPDGILTAVPPPSTSTAPVRTFAHGTAGAYLTHGTDTYRDDVYNAVVVRGQTEDGVDVYGWAVDDRPGSPTAYGGPFGRRPRFHYSPLIDSKSRASATAETMLRRELIRRRMVTVTAPPDPSLDIDDRVAVVDDTGVETVGTIIAATIPLTVDAGAPPASYTIGLDL